MSITKLQDGGGTGRLVNVTSDGRLSTFTITETEEESGVHNGTSYNIETPVINLTTANKSALLYVLNNEAEDLVLTGFFTLTGASTGGAGSIVVEHQFNPTSAGSTLVSAGSAVTAVNKNGGSAKTLDATIKSGVEGSTVDAGLKTITGYHAATGRLVLPITINLPQGTSIAVSVTPQPGNTSMDVMIAIDCYLKVFNL
jgi:hypothetical protein